MLIVCVEQWGVVQWGVLEGEIIYLIRGLIGLCIGEMLVLSEVWLFVFVELSKIVCVGCNYLDYICEFGNDIGDLFVEFGIFFKGLNVFVEFGGMVEYLSWSENFYFEGEFVLVIGQWVCNFKVDEVFGVVFGYICGFDFIVCDW